MWMRTEENTISEATVHYDNEGNMARGGTVSRG